MLMKTIIMAGVLFGSTALAKTTLAETEECRWVQQGECNPMECPKCPKVKKCPKFKKCPKVKRCPKVKKCSEARVKYVNVPVDRIRWKTVDRIVTKTIDAPTFSVGILGGVGPDGVVRDYYDTKEMPGEYVFRKRHGMLGALQVQYRFSPTWSISGMAISNDTFMGGIHWNK